AGRARKAMTDKLAPRPAAVGRFVQSAAGAVRRRIGVPRRSPGLPQRSVNDARIARFERQVDSSGVRILEERFRPALPAVGRTEHAALLVGAIGMTQRRDQQDIGVAWVDEDLRNLLGV